MRNFADFVEINMRRLDWPSNRVRWTPFSAWSIRSAPPTQATRHLSDNKSFPHANSPKHVSRQIKPHYIAREIVDEETPKYRRASYTRRKVE
jgi:hypothetical protein